MDIKVLIQSIEYENTEIKVNDEPDVKYETIPLTIVRATVITDDVYIEGTYNFKRILESRTEINEVIKELYV